MISSSKGFERSDVVVAGAVFKSEIAEKTAVVAEKPFAHVPFPAPAARRPECVNELVLAVQQHALSACLTHDQTDAPAQRHQPQNVSQRNHIQRGPAMALGRISEGGPWSDEHGHEHHQQGKEQPEVESGASLNQPGDAAHTPHGECQPKVYPPGVRRVQKHAKQGAQRRHASGQRAEEKAHRRKNAGVDEGNAAHGRAHVQHRHQQRKQPADQADADLVASAGVEQSGNRQQRGTNDQRHQNQARDEEFIGHMPSGQR
ncbi:hypothetical protein [Diaphorobacter caeni]|uniref:hypothetical protein n=1 Tax=Diaphorobacter caeni TaxID=2784387 RepID=UPI001E5FBAED|nr:hypothetical protein [Diaphorobacter caeni]